MLHGIDIELRQYEGICMGLVKTEPLDKIFAIKGGNRRLIGYVARAEDATVLLIRHLKPDVREPVRKEVERLRLEQGGCSISKRISCVPDPKAIKAYCKGELKKNKTTVIVPDEVTSEESETSNDE